jgi:hypothetical protein
MSKPLVVPVIFNILVLLSACATGNTPPGDAIVVREVNPDRHSLKVGDMITVRGQYRLASRPKAAVMVSTTTHGPSGATRVLPASRTVVDQGSGSFELNYKVTVPGSLHVSFYEWPSGSSFFRADIVEIR